LNRATARATLWRVPFVVFDTQLGPCALAWSGAGATFLQLPEATRDETVSRLVARSAAGEGVALPDAPPWVREAVTRLTEHLAGKPQDLSRVPIDLSGISPFRAQVYRALQRVPAGRTTSYGELARDAGSPGAARAVGAAMGKNPLPLLVPCHRVLATNGEGGFSAYGGVLTKEKILRCEGVALQRQTSLFDASRAGSRGTKLPFDAAEAVVHLTRSDPPLGKHIARVGPLRLELKDTEGTFATLAESIVYQQLSGKAAATIFSRVRALYPKGQLDPKRVLASSDADLRGAGLSAAKTASVRDLATRTARGEVPTMTELGRMEDEAIIERLTTVRGVGRWTVEMLLIFRLGRPDVLPVADYGIKKGFAQVFTRRRSKELPTAEELAGRAERWRPFRSVASWYLWRALDT
jgi:methylated-DNA-[protein]-cysteine S-methyltransferase